MRNCCQVYLKLEGTKRLPKKSRHTGVYRAQDRAGPSAKPWVSPAGFQGKGEKEYTERSKAGVERKVSER